jgi:hypothetical protein
VSLQIWDWYGGGVYPAQRRRHRILDVEGRRLTIVLHGPESQSDEYVADAEAAIATLAFH